MFTTYTDKFFKENLIYIAFWSCWTILSVFAAGIVAYDGFQNGAFGVWVLGLLFLVILTFSAVGLRNVINCLKLPSLKVDTDRFLFTYAEKSYDFDMLLPYYNVKKSNADMMFLFSIHFKDGTSLDLKLPLQVGLAFAEKYLNKYSKPDTSLYFSI